MEEIKPTENNYISLREATSFCAYSQDYLNLLIRKGKLRGVKIGRNWVTTREWLEGYVNDIESKKNVVSDSPVVAVSEPAKHVNNLSVFAFVSLAIIIMISPFFLKDFFVVPFDRGTAAAMGAKNVLSEAAFLPEFIFANPVTAISFVVNPTVTFVPRAVVFSGQGLDGIGGRLVDAASLMNDAVRNFNGGIDNYLARRAADFVLSANNVGRRFGIPALFSGRGNSQASSVPANPLQKLLIERKVNTLEEDIVDYTSSRFDNFRKDLGLAGTGGSETTGGSPNQGMVVVPSTDKNEEVKKKIKASFSDDVEVKSVDDNSGIIVPEFKEKKGDEYLFMLVPVNNKKTE